MTKPDLVTITIERRILEHPDAVHLNRIRSAIWLYLILLARVEGENRSLVVDPSQIARSMGLKEGTIRSWIGHLRKGRYLDTHRTNGALQIQLRRFQPVPAQPTSNSTGTHELAAKRIARVLGEETDLDALEEIAKRYPAPAIRKALAATLAVPSERIRRSRTALFLYLIKRHEQTNTNDPRH